MDMDSLRNRLSGVNTQLNPEKPEPVRVLLGIYERRPDLQEAFPEVKDRNPQRLINWAAAVVSQGGFETEYSTLLAHRSWYLANANKVRATHIFEDILLHINKPLVHALKGLFDETDISEHLTTLSMLSVEFELRNTLELGVRTGESTVALNEAASAIEGYVFSVDLYDCAAQDASIASEMKGQGIHKDHHAWEEKTQYDLSFNFLTGYVVIIGLTASGQVVERLC